MDQPSRTTLETKLQDLASNHRWTWDHPTTELLAELPGADPTTHPAATVADLDEQAWETITADSELVAQIEARHADLQATLADKPSPDIAYISAEFGISELVPQYSGGLGILAGDHLKSASDIALPLVGVGLFYRQGFFRQVLDGNKQAERYEICDPNRLGFADTGVTVTVEVPIQGEAAGTAPTIENVTARVWRLAVGRVDLYVLDTDVETNSPIARAITDRLYSGDSTHRVHQELILGIGGLRALQALDIEPRVVHLNEGHAGFLLLEKLQIHLAGGASWDEAIELTKASAVFTTHTPVPAGIDRFDREIVAPFITAWAEANGVEPDVLYQLAASPDDDGDPKPFNMAVLCLALTGAANGVSKLHGEVSRQLFGSVPAGPTIGSVTNGVHARTWVAPDLAELFDMQLGTDWDTGQAPAWDRVAELDNDEIKSVMANGRRRLIGLIASATDANGDPAIATANLDPEALTIGFARRFATYKRADLLLSEPSRLIKLLADDSRPVQFVFAGKAHPADVPGKEIMSRVVAFARSPEANGRFIFLPDYEMAVARAMYAGCDIWLNNPIRPREASGTSGEKAALNGGLQLSILDGWWDEMYDGENGWAIVGSESDDPATRDKEEATSIFELLENQVLPLFYAGQGRPTTDWLAKVRHNWTTLGPRVTSTRMVTDYRDEVYNPARERHRNAFG